MDNEKLYIEIPDELEVKREIQTIIKRGMVKEMKNRKKTVLISTAAAMFALVLLGFAFPGYASQIPIIGGIFETYVEDDVIGDHSHLQDSAQEVNLSVNVGDVSLTIEEIAIDGESLYFTYVVRSEASAISGYQVAIENLIIYIDGEKILVSSFGFTHGVLQEVGNDEYIGVSSIRFIDDDVSHIDAISFNINFIDVNDVVFGSEDTIFEANNTPIFFFVESGE